jgi:hypothetical protein
VEVADEVALGVVVVLGVSFGVEVADEVALGVVVGGVVLVSNEVALGVSVLIEGPV